MFESHQGRGVVPLSKTFHLHFLCVDYICPGRHTIYMSTIFCTVFRHCRHDCGLRHMCLHLYGHRAISLMGFYNGPMQSRRQTMRISFGHRAVSAAVHRNRRDIARHPCGFRTEAVRRSHGGCVILMYFLEIRVPNVYNSRVQLLIFN